MCGVDVVVDESAERGIAIGVGLTGARLVSGMLTNEIMEAIPAWFRLLEEMEINKGFQYVVCLCCGDFDKCGRRMGVNVGAWMYAEQAKGALLRCGQMLMGQVERRGYATLASGQFAETPLMVTQPRGEVRGRPARASTQSGCGKVDGQWKPTAHLDDGAQHRLVAGRI
jgi:hypothetical protein